MNQREIDAGVIVVPRAANSAASCSMVMSVFSLTRRMRNSRCGSSLE
jgi:hypothetical protein